MGTIIKEGIKTLYYG